MHHHHGAMCFGHQSESCPVCVLVCFVFFDCLYDLSGGEPLAGSPPPHHVLDAEHAVSVDVYSFWPCGWAAYKVDQRSRNELCCVMLVPCMAWPWEYLLLGAPKCRYGFLDSAVHILLWVAWLGGVECVEN